MWLGSQAARKRRLIRCPWGTERHCPPTRPVTFERWFREFFGVKKKPSNRSRKTKETVPNEPDANHLGWLEKWRQALRPAPLNKKWSVEEKESILDYLHGDIAPNEARACCYYEYARASETFRKARREYVRALRRFRGKRRLRLADAAEQSSSKVFSNFPGWVTAPAAVAVWQCSGFPRLPWRKLTDTQQKKFLLDLAPTGPSPVITDVRMLAGMKIFEKFEQAARAASKHNEPMGFPARVKFPGTDSGVFRDGYKDVRVVLPVQKEAVQYFVFTLNYEDGVDATKEGIFRWLHNEENQKLFGEYYKKPIHKQKPDSPGRYKELLKFLAAWRLYHEFAGSPPNYQLGFKKAAEWTKKNRRQYTDALRLKTFFREKPSKGLNISPLYKEGRLWEAAIRKAQEFLEAEFFERPEKNAGRSAAGKKYREALAAERRRGLT